MKEIRRSLEELGWGKRGEAVIGLGERIGRMGRYAMTDWIGKRIGKYEIKELLGRGGMATVYKAFHPDLERDVAIKMIHPHLASDPGFVDRFRREARTVAALRHPGIVQVHDFDVEDATCYMVMEFIQGESLEKRLRTIHERGERMPLDEALRISQLVTKSVAYAHAQGVVHRDLKPANVMLTPQGQPILTDFGLSKIVSAERLTASGAISGTPAYMSPEQCRGEAGEERSDVYSLGVMLYELTAGALPFSGDTPVEFILKHISEPLPPPRSLNPDLPIVLEQVIQKALKKDPADRFQSAQEMLKAFEQIVSPMEELQPSVLEMAPSLDDRCPYRGLQVFEEEHAEFYFGREALVGQLVERIHPELAKGTSGRFLAVVGPSGSGKSSLVRAGLIPAIRKGALPGSEGWIIHVFRPGSRPLENLATQLAPTLDREGDLLGTTRRLLDHLSADGRALYLAVHLALRDAPLGQRLVLVVDQFEEIFTLCRDGGERRRFIENLLYAATVSAGRVGVVLAMRADFYPHCAAHRELARRMSERQMLVSPMSEDELRRAIERPAQLVGCKFEAGLVELLLHDVRDQPGGLPLLQHALLELWRRREGRRLTHAAYQAIGGVEGALERRAEAVYSQFGNSEKEICQRVFLRLMQPGEGTEDTKRRVPLQELLPVESSGREMVETVIQTLADARLVTTEGGEKFEGEQFIEVAHEALIRNWSRLREWIERDRAILLAHRRLTEAVIDWGRHEHDPSYLYLDARLARAKEWAQDHIDDLSPLELKFLMTSALYDADPEATSWGEGLAPESQLEVVEDALLSEKLSVEASQKAISSLFHWAAKDEEPWREQALAILDKVASLNSDFSTRLLALEAIGMIGGDKAVADWWASERDKDGLDRVRLLASLWDRGMRVMPASSKARWIMCRVLLGNRLRRRRAYIMRWVLYGAAGSAVMSLVAGLLNLLPLPVDVTSAVMLSVLGGLGLSFGLSFGELFEGWLRAFVRILMSVTIAFSAVWLTRLALSLGYGQEVPFWKSAIVLSTIMYTLAIGVGTSLGELWPKKSGLGYLVFGCLGAILVYRSLYWSLGALISLGVVLGTGVAKILELYGLTEEKVEVMRVVGHGSAEGAEEH